MPRRTIFEDKDSGLRIDALTTHIEVFIENDSGKAKARLGYNSTHWMATRLHWWWLGVRKFLQNRDKAKLHGGGTERSRGTGMGESSEAP